MEAARIRDGTGGARAASILAWSLAALAIAMFLASVLLLTLVRTLRLPDSWDVNLSLGLQVSSGALFLVFPLVGALIASRRPRNPVGWILLADGLLFMLSGVFDYYRIYGVAVPGSLPFPVVVAAINGFLWVPAVGLLGTYVFLLFPNGRLPTRRWRALAWLSGVMIFLVSVGAALAPGPLPNLGGVQNPFGILPPWMVLVFWATLPLLPLCILASVFSLVLRYRRSTGDERQQIKWIALAAAVVGLLYVNAMIFAFVFPSGAWFQAGSPLWLDVIGYTALLSFTLVPIAVGFAVLKYRLYDIDVIINRALVYGSLTITLVSLYFGGVVATQALFRILTGQQQQSQLAVVISTLAIAALFNPLRRRFQSLIDRRFYRRKYDAARVLEVFSARLRDETDLDRLEGDVVAVVLETVQPEHASMWVRPPADTGDGLGAGR
jgi:MFS family permease